MMSGMKRLEMMRNGVREYILKPVDRDKICSILTKIEAELAENGQVAVDKFKGSGPGYYDAILMDVRMPVLDGLGATEAIRALDHPDAKKIPIIAMTANAFDEDVQNSVQAGMNAHLSKPVEPDRLYETLRKLVGRRAE